MPTFSVIVCSIDPEKQKAIRSEYERALADSSHEFILIPDARSLAEGYNRGFAQSQGEIIVFSHDDFDICSDSVSDKITSALEVADLIGVAGTSRLAGGSWTAAGRPYLHGRIAYPRNARNWIILFGEPSDKIEALDGVFLAARRNLCEVVPFDETTFDGFHLYDLDFSHRAFLAGFRLGLCDITLLHRSMGSHDDKWRTLRTTIPGEAPPQFATEPVPGERPTMGHGAVSRFSQVNRPLPTDSRPNEQAQSTMPR